MNRSNEAFSIASVREPSPNIVSADWLTSTTDPVASYTHSASVIDPRIEASYGDFEVIEDEFQASLDQFEKGRVGDKEGVEAILKAKDAELVTAEQSAKEAAIAYDAMRWRQAFTSDVSPWPGW